MSVETPARGGLLLGESTEEHARFFREGAAAEFWEDSEGFLRKGRY